MKKGITKPMKYEVVKFDAYKPAKEEVTVKFRTKDGKIISFLATKITKVKTPVRFKAKGK